VTTVLRFLRSRRQALRRSSSTAEATRDQRIAAECLRRSLLDITLPTARDTLLDFPRLLAVAGERANEYRSAAPFPHVVIDAFLPEESFRNVLEVLPRVDEAGLDWGNLNANLPDGRPSQLRKYHLQNVLLMKPPLRQLIWELNSGPFMVILQQLTGLQWLLPDPHLQGGGVHVVEPGGLLRVHADFTKHPAFNLDRRLNLLLFMNPDWKDEYGGHLELWDEGMSRCVQRLSPIANRCVIFNTSLTSFHGHPHPLTCPQGCLRRSIALYYYTAPASADAADTSGHATLWQELPGERGGE
jgi:hypothetical protein